MPHETIAPLTVTVTDEQLKAINDAFCWTLYMIDGSGKRIGGGATETGLDERVAAFRTRFDCKGKRILEPACYEGVLTWGLCAAGADVTAFDVRPTCVLKTFARCCAFGFYPRLLLLDAREMASLGSFDAIFHSGLLYHLPDPAAHLRTVAAMAPVIALHTHTARAPEDQGYDASILTTHEGYEGWWFTERPDHFGELSGIEPKSFWPTRTELRRMAADCGLRCDAIFELPAPDGWHGFYLLEKR